MLIKPPPPSTQFKVTLGLGSNLGDRLQYLQSTADKISKILINLRFSAIYESDAMLLADAPNQWNIPFLNMVITGDYSKTPQKLLQDMQQIEAEIGRDPNHQTWSPRQIDIDILAYSDKIIEEFNLKIPHTGLLERQFFLKPMAEIYPNWQFPIKNNHHQKTILQLSQENTNNQFNTKITDFRLL